MVILAISFKIRVCKPPANVKVMRNLGMYPHHNIYPGTSERFGKILKDHNIILSNKPSNTL